MNITNDNFLFFTMKAYTAKNYVVSEFEEELKRIKYIKRLIKKYKASGDLKERLILNHIIILANVFGVEPAVKMLFFKLDNDDYDVLKSFLLFLQYLPDDKIIYGIDGQNVHLADITIDPKVSRSLQVI